MKEHSSVVWREHPSWRASPEEAEGLQRVKITSLRRTKAFIRNVRETDSTSLWHSPHNASPSQKRVLAFIRYCRSLFFITIASTYLRLAAAVHLVPVSALAGKTLYNSLPRDYDFVRHYLYSLLLC